MISALGNIMSWEVVALLMLGTTLGTAASIIPGISGVTVMALVLAVVAKMDLVPAFALLASIMAANGFAGSITSIVLNVPGTSTNAATCLDGFPLARKGQAARAIGASATASALGALVGVGVLIATFPIQRRLVLAFGKAEVFALVFMGIVLISLVSESTIVKGLISSFMGMALGLVGLNLIVGAERYTFGILELESGLPIVPAVIGLFSVPELVRLLQENRTVSMVSEPSNKGAWEGVKDVFRRPRLLTQSGAIGSLTGMVPGVGATVSTWLSYFAARMTASERASFGHGNIEGVIGPEGALDATEGGSLVPVFVLGVPGSLSAAFLVAAFQLQGVLPGVGLFRDHVDVIWTIILAMVVANVLTSVLGLASVRGLAKLTFLPISLITPFVFTAAFTGAIATQGTRYGLTVALGFGLLGVVMDRFDVPRAPLIIGMILLPLAETNFHQALQLQRGSFGFLTRPITLGVLLVTLAGLAFSLYSRRVMARGAAEVERSADMVDAAGPVADDTPGPAADAGSDRGADGADGTAAVRSGPSTKWTELFFLIGGLAATATFLAESMLKVSRGDSTGQLFPFVVLIPLALLFVTRLALVIRARADWVTADGDGMDYSLLYVTAWVTAAALVIAALGPTLGSALYVAVFLLVFRPTELPRRVAVAVISALIMGVAVHGIFEVALGVQFPTPLITV